MRPAFGFQKLPSIFSSTTARLSAEIREDAEETMKSGKVATTFCSSTLEMGIDIGSVKMVGQIGSPWSVASLKQRVGPATSRGRTSPSSMYIAVQAIRPYVNAV